MTLAQLDPDANLGKNEQVDYVEQLGNVGEAFPSYTKTWTLYHFNLVLSNSYFKCSDVDISKYLVSISSVSEVIVLNFGIISYL